MAQSADPTGNAFVAGFVTAAFIFVMGLSIYWSGQNTHDLEWNEMACVKTTDRVVDGVVIVATEHCISAQELAIWAQAKGR